MRVIFTILIFISFQSNARVLYVDNSGNDSNNGTSTATAWQTLSKVNLSTVSGDTVLLKAGGVWNERIILTVSNVRFGSYGTGVKPEITALVPLTGFTNSGNIWSATASASVPKLNTVLVDGQMKAKGRYPNTGYLTFSSYVSNTSITGSLTGIPNYTGAELVVRLTHWIIDVTKITSQSGGTLNYSPVLTYTTPLFGGSGYFIQNIESVLDLAGEWCYDSTSKVLKVYSTTSPSVQISNIDTLVLLNNADSITFDGIKFTGANKAAIYLDSCNRPTIKNCAFNYCGTYAIQGIKSSYVTISKDSILNCYTGAVYLRQFDPYTPTVNTCDYALIDSNYIKNNGHVAGMGLGNNCRYVGIYVVGQSPVITNNVIDSSGYVAIFFNGANSLVKNNYVTNYSFVKDDGGAIYTVIGGYFTANYNDGSIIRGNVTLNGIGASAGTSTSSYAPGIYLDDYCKLITVDSNSIYNGYGAGLYLHQTTSITVRNNTIIDSIGACLYLLGGDSYFGAQVIKDNIFYSQNASQYTVLREQGTTLGTMDSNYYSRPLAEVNQFNLNGTTCGLAAWKTTTGKDLNSSGTPYGVTSATPLVYANPTQSIPVSLSGLFYDSRRRLHNNSITIPPFTSTILYKANVEAAVFSNFRFYKLN